MNVRAEPGTTTQVIGQLSKGSEVTYTGKITEEKDGHVWTEVTYDGKTGWVAEKYLTSDNPNRQTNSNSKKTREGGLTISISGDTYTHEGTEYMPAETIFDGLRTASGLTDSKYASNHNEENDSAFFCIKDMETNAVYNIDINTWLLPRTSDGKIPENYIIEANVFEYGFNDSYRTIKMLYKDNKWWVDPNDVATLGGYDSYDRNTGFYKKPDLLVTKKMMDDFGWEMTEDEIAKLNGALYRYGITNKDSIKLFLATCEHESGYGQYKLEQLRKDGRTSGNYEPYERGAGYIQLTHEDTHKKFLESMGDTYSGTETAAYIADNYPWEAAAWFWTNISAKALKDDETGKNISLNEYVAKNGSSLGVYLIAQYYVNGMVSAKNPVTNVKTLMEQRIRDGIKNGTFEWEIIDGMLYVDGWCFRLPYGWNDAGNDYNRVNTYNRAINSIE